VPANWRKFWRRQASGCRFRRIAGDAIFRRIQAHESVPDAPFADVLAWVDNLDLENQAELLELLRERVAAARRK
jgi:hypothetical protein